MLGIVVLTVCLSHFASGSSREFYLQCDVINGDFLLKGTALKNLVLVTFKIYFRLISNFYMIMKYNDLF